MFVQIHMLQSMPPGNLNRDEMGQPKKCVFGGVTRGRISSQCLKRNIRHSLVFKEAFGDHRTTRTLYLPRMIADALKDRDPNFPDDEVNGLMDAIAAKFKSKKKGTSGAEEPLEEPEGEGEGEEGTPARTSPKGAPGVTGQLVFFPPPFARKIAELVADFRTKDLRAYSLFIGRNLSPKPTKQEGKILKANRDRFLKNVSDASKSLTVDIGLFGRMTTSNLVVNVEAACQVAHAISTHETLIESDYFTAMDDEKAKFASTQTERTGAGFLASDEMFFNSGVYYKYLNLDVDALKNHLSWGDAEAGCAAGLLLRASALANPTGKQNSFAAHGVPELILVEVSKAKCPISYANAFLKPVEGLNLMTESANALCEYVKHVAAAFSPKDIRRALLAVGSGSSEIQNAERFDTLDDLAAWVANHIKEAGA